jgi:hypothetical protein
MDNEPISTLNIGDNTDTHSQVNGGADNASRHSSRAGSARSGRSKAASVREATAIDGAVEQKPSANGTTSPKPNVVTNGDGQHPTVMKSKPPSPSVPVVDTPSGEYDEMMHQDDGLTRSETEDIVNKFLIKISFFKF